MSNISIYAKTKFILKMIDNIKRIITKHGGIVKALEDELEAQPAILMALLQIGESLNKIDKEIIKIDEMLNISFSLFNADFLKAFPLKNDLNNKWINLSESALYDSTEMTTINDLIKDYYFSTLNATKKELLWYSDAPKRLSPKTLWKAEKRETTLAQSTGSLFDDPTKLPLVTVEEKEETKRLTCIT